MLTSALRTLTRPLVGGIRRPVERHLPDPLTIALLLTIGVIVAAVAVERRPPLEVLSLWGNGAFSQLALSMQVLLLTLAGMALAGAAPLNRALERIAGIIATPGRALAWVTLVALTASLLHWGLGLVAGALMARALARQIAVDYRLLVASAYSGLVVWHGGLSGRIPQMIAAQGHDFAERIGTLALADTLLTPYNLGILAGLAVILPLLNRLLGLTGTPEGPTPEAQEPLPRPRRTHLAERLAQSHWLAGLLAAPALLFVAYDALWLGRGLTLNTLILGLLATALVLHRTPVQLYHCLEAGAAKTAGVILQFPLYAGIMAVMAQSGLALSLTDTLLAPATAASLPLWVFLGAGTLNLLVPPGGEQWLMQAPAVIHSAETLGMDLPRAAMAVAWGDAWSNLIQPFWALPMLAITGLRARDILGVGLIQLVVTGLVIGAGLLWL
ncbi:TIGR00366 family protein [Vreelandella jeotgali]|uniref:TIGR00366 family protein n=1 Tax=Vreelandella jeotgali TaxID=553386 RepID=UPI00034C0FD0|nr:TIGR00366 family protein [Halomonas jeotgali]